MYLSRFRTFIETIKCGGMKFGGYNFPKLKCVDNQCHSCHLSSIEDLLAICVSAAQAIDLEATISYKMLSKEEEMTPKGKKFFVPIFKSVKTTIRVFLNRFLDFLTGTAGGKIPFILHYTRKCWQREAYNAHTNKIREGELTKTPMLVHDNSEAIKLKNAKVTSDQHYSYKKVNLSGIVALHHDGETVGFMKNSNFYIVENAVKLGVDFTLEIMQEKLEELKQDGCEMALIWTDGSVKEYLQKKMIGNIETMGKELGIN